MIIGSGKQGFHKESEFENRANGVEEGVELVDGGPDAKAGYFLNRANDEKEGVELVNEGSDAKVGDSSNRLVKDEDKKIIIEHSEATAVVHEGTGTDRQLVLELNGCVESELKHENVTEITDIGPTSIKVEFNKETQGGDNLLNRTKEDGNAVVTFQSDGVGNELIAEIANKGAGILANSSTVVGDENKIKVADTMVLKHGLEDSHVSGIIEPTCQLHDAIPDMEAKCADVKASVHHKEPVSGNHLLELETSHGLKDQALVVDGLPKAMQSGTMGINVAEEGPFGNIQNKCNFNLVVDLNPQRNLLEVDMDIKPECSELNLCVSDLVWGKVRGHPWWPGQIFDPSSASEKAKRHFKKDCYLIAYFGDQTFAWNEVSKIKPFHTHFSEMEKQSDLENFHHAVDCALDEFSRRVEFGLSCPCLPEEVFTKLKTQIITNSGIQKQSSRRYGGDKVLNATSFEPKKLVNFVKSLAQTPLSETGRLDFVILCAQLSAFYRSKGYPPICEFIVFDGLLDNDMEVLYMGEKEQNDDHANGRKLKTRLGFSHKRKRMSSVRMQPSKKKRSLSELMSENCLYIRNGEHVVEKKAGSQSVSHSSSRKRKASEDMSDDYSCESKHRKFIQLENVYSDEMFSQLCLIAVDPMRESHFSSDMMHFFTEFRYFTTQDESALLEQETSLESVHASQTGVRTAEAVDSVTSAVEPCKDSYWTDRIIQSINEEQLFFKNYNEGNEFLAETSAERGSPAFKPEATAENSENLDFSQREADGRNLEFVPSKVEPYLDESIKEEICPTSLILKFTNMDTVPSEANLNQIFGRFGPLIESRTKLLKKKNRAIVVFERYSDAQRAFSSSGKYEIFGPSLESYSLKTMPPTSKQATASAGKQRF
ncbi:hypothetical protein L6164_033631 [Bauhinia variegata]|nr:hypothetical protein L6164_033631 [Bauhinia variegata]